MIIFIPCQCWLPLLPFWLLLLVFFFNYYHHQPPHHPTTTICNTTLLSMVRTPKKSPGTGGHKSDPGSAQSKASGTPAKSTIIEPSVQLRPLRRKLVRRFGSAPSTSGGSLLAPVPPYPSSPARAAPAIPKILPADSVGLIDVHRSDAPTS